MNNNYNSNRTRQIPIWKSMFAIIVMLLTLTVGNAQVTTNGGSGLNPTYPDLASAITALNGATISSPVIITLTGGETAPVGGYSITAQGTAANTILIQGSASTITASGALVAGTFTDAVFKLVGADYVTLQSFTMRENAANTTTAAATNNMTEWGVALLYATTTNGAQNNTIQNNNIVLNRTYQNTFGIYSNSTHAATTPTTSATATSATGGNHALKIYTNAISNVNNGIVVVGPTAVADQNTGLDIGGSSLATANTITDYGTTGTFSAYANVSGSVNGILVRNSNGTNVSYNTVTSSVGGVTAGTLNGIQVAVSSNAPTSTFTNTINNNNISLKSGLIAGAMNGINYPSGSASATSIVNINNNDFNNFGHTVAGTGNITFILSGGADLTKTINGNTYTNISVNTTGTVYLINNNSAANTFTVSNNAVVGTFAKTGVGGILYGYYNFGSPTGGTATIINNNFSNMSVTGATTFYGIRQYTSVTQIENIVNNTVSNITGGTSQIFGISHGYGAAGSNVNGNIVNAMTCVGAINGINLGDNTAGTVNCFSNVVNGLTSTAGATVVGISNTLGVTNNIYKNKIYNLEANNAGGSVNGISIASGTTISVYNNIIGDLRTPISNAANPLIGINITGGTTVNAYNNTVMLNATSAGVLFGSSAISVSTTPTVTLRNNIFVNNSSVTGAGLAVAYRRSSTTLTSYAAASNNNLFYASNIFTDGTNTDATLGGYKTRVASRDASSVSENPTFVSTVGANSTFLHIDTTVGTQIESGGATVAAVTDDFDGDIRNATTPDIGADEFAGILLDIVGPTITHTAVSNDCAGGTRTISATITDASGVPTSGAGLPVAYWSINAGAYTASAGVSMGAGVYNFSVGTGSVLGDIVSYYFVAQDNAGTPNLSALPSAGAAGFTANPAAVATAPTTPFSYSVITPLNGVYTVGAAGTYATLTAAVAAYNAKCLTGPVTFSLIDATYPSETFPITINQNADASVTNTLTIKPAVGVSPTISGSSASSIFLLNGADYVTIDGSNGTTVNMICPLSNASRDLTVTNTNAGTSSAVVWLATNVANGATNNKIINVNVVGNSNTTTLVALGSGSSTISMSSLGTLNNNNSFINNAISKTQIGIYSQGASAGSKNSGTVINQNVMNTIAPNNVSKGAIVVGFENNIAIVANAISEIAQTSSPDVFGISLGVQGISTTTFTGNEVTNATVAKNAIGNIRNTGTFSAVGICVAPATSGTNTITNNMISGVSANGTSGDFSAGIFVGGGVGSTTQIYHNTVTMIGTQTGGSDKSYALAIAGSDPIVDVRNNILINTQNNGSGNNYAVAYGYATFANLTSSYNDYVVGAGATFFIGATGSISAPINQLNIAALQTATGKDSNAQNITPAFTSATDLHIIDGTLDNLGAPIATVVDDFNCEARSATTPDMGADEFTFLNINHFNIVNGFKAYPNPVSNILNIEYTGELSNVTVYNLLGQQMLTKKVTATSTQIDMSGLNAGTYLVKVDANEVSKTLKVVKK